ncbi:esterase FE4-like isoform X2 [Cylas formicarius]|uniref:esterase FE4-like isoform X2 n=1 Tax=Cylas formicarius TaxID=197179 RepID=UPI00295847A5|nr:esterase FE4-like isoform X2 [Cylas formicarius]
MFAILVLFCVFSRLDALTFLRKHEENKNYQVRTSNGLIQGSMEKSENGVSYYSFMGIPYAQPPVGDLRFRDPKPLTSWSGVLNTTSQGPCCAGFDTLKLKNFELLPYGSEDCLYLNVFTPTIYRANNSHKPLPVMVYFVGGAFFTACPLRFIFGPDYFMENEAVLVTLASRTSMFGYMSTEDMECPGNWATKDQIAALKWVKTNIRNFGGDSKKVVIFGQSAGASNVNTLLVAPKAKGLFQGAIMQSGSNLCPWAFQATPRKIAFDIGMSLGITTNSSKELLRIFRSLPSEDLMKAQILAFMANTAQILTTGLAFAPVIEPRHENAAITDYTYDIMRKGNFNKVPVILGINSLEIKYFEGLVNLAKMPVLFLADLSPGTLVRFTNSIQKKTDAGNQIASYFTGSRTFLALTQQEVLKYLSEDMYVRPMRKTASLLSEHTAVYFYYFSYEGDLALQGCRFMVGNYDRNVKGVGHAEDIFYQFKANFTDPASINDQLTIKRLTKLWINLAKTGFVIGILHQGETKD